MKFEAPLQQADRKELIASVLMDYALMETLPSRDAVGCFFHFCPCQEVRPFLTEDDIQRGIKKRELDELRRNYTKQKGFTVIEMWECEWWRLYKTGTSVDEHIREMFPYRRSLAECQLLGKIKSGKMFGYVQCDIEVPNKLKPHFAYFPPIFKKQSDRSQIYWQVDEAVRRRRGLDVSTSENANFKLDITKWNAHYSSAAVLSGVETSLYKNRSLHRVHSEKVFQ